MLRRIKIDAKFYFLMIQLLLLLLLLYYYEDVLPLICIMSYCNASIILTRNITDFSIMMNHGKFFIYCFPTLIRWRRKERERERKEAKNVQNENRRKRWHERRGKQEYFYAMDVKCYNHIRHSFLITISYLNTWYCNKIVSVTFAWY